MEIWLNINLTLVVFFVFGLSFARLTETDDDWVAYPVAFLLIAMFISWPLYIIAWIWIL